jgi:membrane protein DedA with SNARE-associated domain
VLEFYLSFNFIANDFILFVIDLTEFMFETFTDKLLSFSSHVPVEVFTFIAAFVEEIIAPIPSPVIMTTAGALANSQGNAMVFLFWISLVGAVSKLLASWILYFVADKAETVVLTKYGKFFGIDHSIVDKISTKFNGGVGDYFTMFALRAIPVVPSAPVSVLAGVFKVKLKPFLVGTFTGTLVRNMFYLYIGFTGVDFYDKHKNGLDTAESYVQIGLVLVAILTLVYFKFRKKLK